MNPARHARASELFLEAVELPTHEQSAFLHRALGDDIELLREVENLLARDGAAAAIDRPVAVAGPGLHAFVADQDELPRNIGGYEIISLLGHGGMGTVFRARQVRPDRLVALKVLNASSLSPTMVRRFEFETRVLAQLQHPGIAQIYESGIADAGGRRIPFFAMELVDGLPVTEFANSRELSLRQRLGLLVDVCFAVQHAHQKGVIHRDLKPANILVADGNAETPKNPNAEISDDASRSIQSALRTEFTRRGGHSALPKILDFGVARTIDPDLRGLTLATSAGQIIGTLPYMSPEQVSGDSLAVDTRSDIYALAVTGYELLTGRLPYDLRDKPLPDAIRVIQEAAPAPLSSIDRAWKGDLETIFSKALAKEKERRYASVSDFAADLGRFLRDEPIAARPPSRIYQLRKFARRNRLLVASLAAALFFLITAVVGTGIGWTRARTAETKALRKQAESEAVSQFLVNILMTPSPGANGRDVTVVEALEAARREIETAFPDQPAARAAVLAELGAVYHGLGRLQEALTYLRRAYELRREVLGENHPETYQSMNNLGIALLAPNDPARMKEAQALLERALDVAGAVHGSESVQAAAAHNSLANVAWRLGDYPRAESLTRQALRIARALGTEGEPTALCCLVNLAVLSGRRGDHAAMETQLREVLALRERTQGSDHPDTMRTVAELANSLVALNRGQEAEPLYLENIERRTRVLGKDHPETLVTAHQYANCLYLLGRAEESESLLRRTLAQEREVVGPSHHLTTSTLSLLADIQFRAGRYADAQEFFTELTVTAEELQGLDAPDTLVKRVWVALCMAEQGRLEEAGKLLDDVGPRIKRDLAEYTEAHRLHSVARAKQLWTKGDFAAAENALLAAEQGFRAEWGADHVCTKLCRIYLGQLYAVWNQPDKSANWTRRLAADGRP